MPKNTGYIEKPEKDEDYIAGVNSPIEYHIRVFNGDFGIYNSQGEEQKQNGVESMGCATQSGYGKLQPQLNWMIDTNHISPEFKKFLLDNGFIVDGKVRLSKRAIAILSGTTPQGNYLEKVARTIRKYGLIPEILLPQFGDAKTWNEYMDENLITEEMLAIGKESKKYINIQYEWVITPRLSAGKSIDQLAEIMMYHEKQAPLQIAKDGHATYFYNAVKGLKHGQRDTYKPFDRTKPWAYNPPYVMKIVITEKAEFTEQQIDTAAKKVLDVIVKQHKRLAFFRPDTGLGEAYFIDEKTGRFTFETAKGSMFKRMTRKGGEIVPIPESLWTEFKPAEIK